MKFNDTDIHLNLSNSNSSRENHPALRWAAMSVVCAALVACGGGSSDSAEDSSAADGSIAKTCAQDGNNVSVTQDGCLTYFGNNDQTVACTGANTLHMLSGKGWTREELVRGGSKTTAGSGQFGFNQLTLRCV
ncbi:hypothetical protein [Hydrogenophaga sp. 5NK40-0174]|uniref:hypothetical protein n=1 Tax=Hydrogenophaga sp. 5NK40-0174 TaxID=3127649 RepID=UPI00310BB13A